MRRALEEEGGAERTTELVLELEPEEDAETE
jgi:hypothetical protein